MMRRARRKLVHQQQPGIGHHVGHGGQRCPVVGNQALYFDGNDIVHVAGLGSLTMSSTVTMEAWVRQQAGATTEQLILNKEGEYELG